MAIFVKQQGATFTIELESDQAFGRRIKARAEIEIEPLGVLTIERLEAARLFADTLRQILEREFQDARTVGFE